MCVVPAYYFRIRSQLSKRVLDVEFSNTSPGALVSTFGSNDSNAQRWWEDPITGTIRSVLNGFCLDIQDDRLVLNPYEAGKADQLWQRKGSAILARHDSNVILEIADSNTGDSAKVIKANVSGGRNQAWTFELV